MKYSFDAVAARLNSGPGPSPWVRCVALVLGLLILPFQAAAAISVDFANGAFADSNTVSWNHTSSGAPNSILLVGLSINSFNNVGLSVTYNGLPLTRTVTTGTGNPKAEIWYLWNPPAGNWPVVANITTPDKFCAGSVTYQGVGALGAAANRMTGFTTTADVSLTTTQADSWIFGMVSVGDNATLSSLAGQSNRYSQATTGGGSYNRGAGDDKVMGAPALGTLSWDLGGSFTSGLAALELRAFVSPTATRTPSPSRTPTRTPSVTPSPTWTATPCSSLSGVGVAIGGGASGTVFSAGLNVGAGLDRLLVASIDTDPGVSVVAVSFNGAPFTFAGGSGTNRNLETWYLANPDVANVSVQVITSASGAVNFGVVNYRGADTALPIGVSTSDSRGANTGFNYDLVGVTAGSYVQGHTWTSASAIIGRGAGQVSMWSGVQGGAVEGDIKTAPGGGTVNLSYTFSVSGVTEARAVEVRRAPCVGGPTFTPTRSPSPSPTPGAACAAIIRDIRPGLTGSSSMLTALLPSGRVVFGAADGFSGSEPWVTDGTFAGTYQIVDLFPGATGGFPLGFTSHAGWVYFAGDNGSTGQELWRTDGTGAGTTLVADIQPGATGSFPTNLFSWGGMLYFTADDGVNGSELWRWDGAAATLVKDINVGGGTSSPYGFTDAGAFFYFFANDGINGNELWRSDGSTGGTFMVKDIAPGAASSFGGEPIHAGGGVLYFAADDGVNGKELWTSDGGTPGTVMVKDINPGLASSTPVKMVWTGLRLIFSAVTAAEGRELHYSDGTLVGTQLAADMNAGAGNGSPDWLRMLGGAVYFTADTAAFGTELWVTDALGSVVNLVSDINPGAASSSPAGLTLHNGLLYFRATDATAGLELWRSDGGTAGTTLVQDLNPGAAGAVVDGLRSAGSWLFFIATNGASGTEPFRADDCGAPVPTATASPTAVPASTATSSPTASPSLTPSVTATPSASPSVTPTPTPALAAPLTGYFGHQSVVALTYSFFLSDSDNKAAFRFTAPAAKTVSAVRVRVQSVFGSSPFYRIGLQGDNGAGAPDGVWIGGGPIVMQLSSGWNTAAGLSAPLSAGLPYYAVVEYDSGLVDGSNYAFLQHGTEPHHRLIPYDQSLDGAIDALASTNGTTWSVGNRQPEFTLDFSDASSFGCPFHAGASRTIYAAGRAAQYFRGPAADAAVNRVGCFVRRGSGVPADDLYYTLEDVTGSTVLESGLLWSAGASSDVAQWVEKDLSQAHSLRAGRDYRLSLYSPASTLANPWYFIGGLNDNTAYYNDLSYDGAFSRAQQSADGGGSWSTNLPSQDLGFRFSFGLVPTPTPSDTRTATPSFSVSPTRTISATRTLSATPSASPTFTETPTQTGTPAASPTPTVTVTPCDLIVSGPVSLLGGVYNYCNVVVQSGGVLTVSGVVTLNLSGNLQVDSGGVIRGTGNGSPGMGIQSNGSGLGGGGQGNGAGGAGGGGHGGAGGSGSNYVNGGMVFGVPTAPNQMGSSGGSGNTGLGGSGGAALVVNALGDAWLDGSLEFNGQFGGNGGSANLSSGGGGAGGSLWINAQTVNGSGTLMAMGGNGGNSGCGTASCWGGGGGGGGRVALCAVLADNFLGPVNVSGGGPGAGNPMAQPGGNGTLYRCATAADTPTSTATPTSTVTVTFTVTSTSTATPTVSPSPTPSATESATPTVTASVTPSATESVTPTASPTQTVTLTSTFSATGSASPSATRSATPTATATPTVTLTASSSPTPSATESATPTVTSSQTLTLTPTLSVTESATPTVTATLSASPSASASGTPSETASVTPSRTTSPSPSDTATLTASPSASPTFSATPTASPTATPSATVTATPSQTPAPPLITLLSPSSGLITGGYTVVISGSNLGASATVTFGGSVAPVVTGSFSSVTVTVPAQAAGPVAVVVTMPGGLSSNSLAFTYQEPSPTATPSGTVTPTPSMSPSATASPSTSASPTPSASPTQTPFVSPTPSPSISPTLSVTDTPLPTATPEIPAVLSHNVWRPGLGQPLHIGIKSPVGGRVTVNVYNVAAERVRRPFEADVPAGVTVDALWDGRNDQGEPCGAGVYLVSIRGAGIQRTLKVVLLK